ncbi:hypothetical protein EDB19DRAFT_1908547 [Suillus lakei]|nr:hypothetical protein EDB19DRAFT_1908547 [Suillus lakei]
MPGPVTSNSVKESTHSSDKSATAETGWGVVREYLENIFSALFKELKEQFPPPNEAPGHEKRIATVSTVLDRVEEWFLQVVGKFGVSGELLKSLTSSFKFGVKHVVVTIGDVCEQHPYLVALALLAIVISVLSSQGILLPILRIVGFGPLGPIKGGIAAWLQGWWFGPAVSKGSWFAMLQCLAMIG